MIFNFHGAVASQSASLGGFTYVTLSRFLFCKKADCISMDQHNHLDGPMIFHIKRILYLLHVPKSLKVSEFSSCNPASVALAFNSPLIYFLERTDLKSISFSLQLSTFIVSY